ncbi:ORF9 [Halorubrum pleomorphic virus 6]|uniref:ORF9 n=1 Tax=Halorubrum pleomorphic virus 6 TaxID=1156721 RepID=H9ABQ0_9VIRU|nr:ORF9 [Halorubrum pleomorphic virus 6]AFD04020.1 ORF9 [Halorubrum pleomorphic virus 6]
MRPASYRDRTACRWSSLRSDRTLVRSLDPAGGPRSRTSYAGWFDGNNRYEIGRSPSPDVSGGGGWVGGWVDERRCFHVRRCVFRRSQFGHYEHRGSSITGLLLLSFRVAPASSLALVSERLVLQLEHSAARRSSDSGRGQLAVPGCLPRGRPVAIPFGSLRSSLRVDLVRGLPGFRTVSVPGVFISCAAALSSSCDAARSPPGLRVSSALFFASASGLRPSA